MLMADKTKDSNFDRVYTINLRRSWVEAPRSKRANDAMKEIQKFVAKHTKSKEVKVSKGVNELIFKRGFSKPPGKITVEVKGDREHVQVKMIGEVIVRKEEKKAAGGIAGLKDRLSSKEGSDKKEKIKKAVEKAAATETTPEKVKKAAARVAKAEKKEESVSEVSEETDK
jgi:large subunit ribosomal protein L31e